MPFFEIYAVRTLVLNNAGRMRAKQANATRNIYSCWSAASHPCPTMQERVERAAASLGADSAASSSFGRMRRPRTSQAA